MKRVLSIILSVIMMLCLMACGVDTPDETIPSGPVELWVVTEKTPQYCMNTQARVVIDAFEAENDNVTVRLDILPSDEEERAVYFDQLRTEIMAGKGPDIYLLPVTNVVAERNGTNSELIWEPVDMLISDVALAMRNGVFADISAFYDADEDLDKDSLAGSVMDAGVLDDARYVLPLRYDIPVLYADTQLLEESGISIDSISDISSLVNIALETKDSKWISGSTPDLDYEYQDIVEIGLDYDMDGVMDEWQEVDAAPYRFPYKHIGLSYLGRCIDYEKEELLLTQENLAEFMKLYYQMGQTSAEEIYYSTGNYVYNGVALGKDGYPICLDSLKQAMTYASIASALNRELTMIPMRSVSGELVANVTYYAAVGAGCKYPGLAYQFIREFLSEECQWEQTHEFDNRFNLLDDGWPVRTGGSVESLWSLYCPMVEDYEYDAPGQKPRCSELYQVKLTEMDIPVLSSEVDGARFQISIEWYSLGRIMAQLKNAELGAYSDADIDAMAEEIISDLQWHLAER